MEESLQIDGKALALGAAGTAAAGALFGLAWGESARWLMGLLLPATVVGVALLCAPTLFIGVGLLGGQLSPKRTLAALGQGLGAAGNALLGFVPAGLFLVTTSGSGSRALPSMVALIATGLVVGLGGLWAALGLTGTKFRALFAGWSIMALVLGVLVLGRVLTSGVVR
jgi:hypothetical protein